MKLYLAGPRAGQSVTLQGLKFVSGIANVQPKNAAQISYFERYYQAYPEGSDELHRALEEFGGKEVYYGSSGLPKNPTGTESKSGSDGGTPASQDATDERHDDDSDSGDQGSDSEGSGSQDSGVRIQETVVAACMKLDPVNPKHWTPGGVPKFPEFMRAVGHTKLEITRKHLTSYGLTRTQVADRLDA